MRLRGHLIDACIGLVVTAVIFLPVELLLAALDVGTPPAAGALSRGFDAHASYFVPDPNLPGGWHTQFGRPPERDVPPKGDRRRVLLFGGSNTQGFPAGWLERKLREAAPDVGWEVLNLGRSGYGSGRVSILFEQALHLLEPDVVVIYSGHNEFVEAGFRMDVDEGLAARAARLASRSRTVNLLAGALREEQQVTRATPEAWKWEYEKFAGMRYEETLERLDLYRDNLRRMCAAAADAGVGVVLSTVIYNRFSAPFESTLPSSLTAADRERFDALFAEGHAALPDYLKPLLPEEEQLRVHGFDWTHESAAPENPMTLEPPGRRPALGALAGRDPELTEPWRWHPKIFLVYRALKRLHARAPDADERASLERAASAFRRALELVPDHPRAHFELGLALYLLGADIDTVKRQLEDAARFDRAPRKASLATNERVLAVAQQVPAVLLLDADRLFSERMPDGLVGWEWMLDHCHVNAGAARLLMEDMADLVSERWGKP